LRYPAATLGLTVSRAVEQVEGMPIITVVSGCPGTGKTSVAAALAASSVRGVHIEADVFFHFIVHRIPPIHRDAHDQNATAVRAIAAAAWAFASNGYEVVVDGVIGPWFVPTFMEQLESFNVDVDYLVLRAPLDQTLQRAMARAKTRADHETVVRHMHPGFATLGPFEAHAIETGGQTIDETLAVVARGRSTNRFRVVGKR
jgi:predicted kinase